MTNVIQSFNMNFPDININAFPPLFTIADYAQPPARFVRRAEVNGAGLL